jgi:hypothetical protein
MGIAHTKRLAVWTIAFALVLFSAATAMAATDAYGPGRIALKIISGGQMQEVGTGGIWNSKDKLHVQLEPNAGWRIKGYHIDAGGEADYSPPTTNSGNPKIGHFDFTEEFPPPYEGSGSEEDCYQRTIVLELWDDLAFAWGTPYAEERTQGVAIFLELVRLDDEGNILVQAGAWAVPEIVFIGDEDEEEGDDESTVAEDDEIADEETGEVVAHVNSKTKGGRGAVARGTHMGAQANTVLTEDEAMMEFDGARWGWWFTYELGHPKTGHFIDSPVSGLLVETPTYEGITGEEAYFYYFPGEEVDITLGGVYLGSAVADQKISPLDVFPMGTTEDPKVINMATLLQSLDIDGDPQGTIVITEEVADAFGQAVANLGLESIDFASNGQIDDLIEDTRDLALELYQIDTLVIQSREDAVEHLASQVNNTMFRKNVSQTPELASAKAKLNISPWWFPALAANAADLDGDGVADERKTLEYRDEETNEILYDRTEAHPMLVTYIDNGDVFGAVSMDDGETWKKMNLSRTADISSYTRTTDGTEVLGECKKPVAHFKNNKILVAWTSKYARGGQPRYAESEFLQARDESGNLIFDANGDPVYTEDDNPNYTEDIWGVGGPQRMHNYEEDEYPEIGEVPFSAVWVCRGLIATQGDVSAGRGEYVGDIVWYKPERLTSGRRDPYQIFMGASPGAGFAIVWQEDPEGLNPGSGDGPGHGWSGATTSHKTDIWYSYLTWGDHSTVDANFVEGGDPNHDDLVLTRPKALVPMSLPVRLSNNDVINTDNLMVELDPVSGLPIQDADGNYIPIVNEESESGEGSGTHRYALEVPNLLEDPTDPDNWYTFTNNDGEQKTVAINRQDRLLDGDTGASRPNIFLQSYKIAKLTTDAEGNPVHETNDAGELQYKTSAWAIICYEETKGTGMGQDDETHDGESNEGGNTYVAEEGKNVIYHSFDFKSPELVAEGGIVNSPEFVVDANGDPIGGEDGTCDEPKYVTGPDGNYLTDFAGRRQLAYENARRGRFITQGIGSIKLGGSGSRTAQAMVFKQGPEGGGRPSDIMMVRWVVPAGAVLTGTLDQPVPDNPYAFENLVGEYVYDEFSQNSYWSSGRVNVSSVTPTVVTDSAGDPETDDPYGQVKVVKWGQGVSNLNDLPAKNPWDDARAHRGTIRGDLVTVGFTYTANWAAARNGNDKYDFFIRRSFDGGQHFTTDPEGVVNDAINDPEEDTAYTVAHSITWTHPSGTETPGEKEEEWFYFGAGDFERMRNLSQLPNNTVSALEPRIMATPGTYKDPVSGNWTVEEDKQIKDVYYVSFGTCTNPKKDPVTGLQDEPVPLDLFYTYTRDMGENYYLTPWVVNPDSDGNYAGETVYRWGWIANGDAEQGEAQLRTTPDGAKFYASWLDEGPQHSDIVSRRMLPRGFPQNQGPGGY